MATISYELLHEEIKRGGDKRLARVADLEKYATYLVRGGCDEADAVKLLKNYAITHLDYMLVYSENGGKVTLEHDLDYAFRRTNIELWEGGQKSFSSQLHDWVVTQPLPFSIQMCYNQFQLVTKAEKTKLRVTLKRMVDQGIIKYGTKKGWYEVVDDTFGPEDWQNADDQIAPLWLPFDLDQVALIPYGSVIVLSGASGAGKTAALLNICKENQHKFDIHYFSSEISPGAFKRRINKFPDLTPDMWNINFYNRSSDWEEVIVPGNKSINIVDYIEMHDEFYKVGKYIHAIHAALNGATAILAIQKNVNNDYGLGGQRTIEKSEIAISMDHGQAKLIKIREFNLEYCQESPRNKIYRFKLVDGCRFVRVQGWHTPVKEF